MSMVQLGLHSKCCNKCDFCLLKDTNIDTIDDILNEIETAKKNIEFLSTQEENWTNKYSDGISILGGELFFIQDQRYKDGLLSLIDTVIDKILKVSPNPKCKFSTVSNGMYDPEWLLFPVIDKIVDAVGIEHVDVNFSYDFQYRFHSDEKRIQCENTINAFHKRYNYICGVQMILTQGVIDKYLKGWRTKNLTDEVLSGNRVTFLYPHPINRGNDYKGAKELFGFNFTRKSFFKFIKLLQECEPDIFESFLYSTRNSAVFKYTMMYTKSSGDYKQLPFLSDGKEILSKDCKHSELYKCYSDSDKCMLCDLERLA